MSGTGPERDDLVDLAAVDDHVLLPTGSDDVPQAPASRMDRWPWWRAAGRLERAAAVVAAAALAGAVVLGGSALAARPHVTRVTRTVAAPPLPAGADAIGCALGRTCAVRSLSAVAVASVLRIVPGGQIVLDLETYDVTTGKVYRRYLVVRSADRRIYRLVGQCLPLSQVPDNGSGITVFLDPADAAVIPDLRAWVAGPCTVMAWGRTVDVSGAFPVADDVTNRLVDDPQLWVRP